MSLWDWVAKYGHFIGNLHHKPYVMRTHALPRHQSYEASQCDGLTMWRHKLSHMSASPQPPLNDLGRPHIPVSTYQWFPHLLRTCEITRWSTDKNPPSFSKITVRLVVSANIVLDGHLVALIKLNHAIAGLYMCVRLHMQETGRWYPLNLKKNLSWETLLTVDFEFDVIRRKRPYRWTIWVSHLHHIGHHQFNRSRYTLEPATPACLPSSAYSLSWTAPGFLAR